MDAPIYQYVMASLERAKGKWPEVAEGSGVSRRTIEKIARSEIRDPGISHIEKLYRYFREKEAA
jgi:transcriptional regulator with XRE-family HTH domain